MSMNDVRIASYMNCNGLTGIIGAGDEHGGKQVTQEELLAGT